MFPNPSRVFDATRRAVRFWGHDRSMEFTFFMTEDALRGVQPKAPHGEEGLLTAFDLNRELIYAAASRVYARGRKNSYDLTVSDF